MSSDPGWIALYEDYFLTGLHLLLHPFFLSFLGHYRLVPAQLTLNSTRVISSFIVACHFHGIVTHFTLSGLFLL